MTKQSLIEAFAHNKQVDAGFGSSVIGLGEAALTLHRQEFLRLRSRQFLYVHVHNFNETKAEYLNALLLFFSVPFQVYIENEVPYLSTTVGDVLLKDVYCINLLKGTIQMAPNATFA